jgi:hypothetical protein
VHSISGLFGGARFRKFGPGFIGDDAREVDQCQNGTGTGDLFSSNSVSFLGFKAIYLNAVVIYVSQPVSLTSQSSERPLSDCQIVRLSDCKQYGTFSAVVSNVLRMINPKNLGKWLPVVLPENNKKDFFTFSTQLY